MIKSKAAAKQITPFDGIIGHNSDGVENEACSHFIK